MKKVLSLMLASLLLLSVPGCTPAAKETIEPTKTEVDPTAAYLLAEGVYPEMAPYPNEQDYTDRQTGEFDHEGFSAVYDAWVADRRGRGEDRGYVDSLTGFLEESIPCFLSHSGAENPVCSPLNVYLALGMLAELTDGNSRRQIMDLLGCGDMDTLRSQAHALWTANYSDDGATTTLLASSLWLNEEISFVQPTLDRLAETYHASSYRGKMGTEEFDRALRSWLNTQTGGLLEEQVSQQSMDADTVLALASTVQFRAKWSSEFREDKTEDKVFHTADGEILCPFMHQGGSDLYYWGDRFSAVKKSFEGGEAMWFLLPDEGSTPEQLLRDPQSMELLLEPDQWENSTYLIVNKAIPKFDVVSQLDLCAGLKAMGITDVFDPHVSDFTPMTADTAHILLSQANHDARVTVDEEGCTAVAYTVMVAPGAAKPPEEEVDFVLDRPFLFAITGYDGLPLFVGIVNDPTA